MQETKPATLEPFPVPSTGSLRFESDKRQIGALLMLLGFCAIIQPLAGIAASIGPDGTTVSEGIALSSFIGGLCLAKLGVLSVVTGYNEVVHGLGHRYVTAYLIVFVQTAFITYITDMTNIGRTARDAKMFIPEEYMPSQADYNVVGAFAIISVVAYGFTFVGSISFMLFSLFAYQTGKPESRNGKYYRGRMGFYCGMLFLAGLSQFVLGIYIHENFGGEDLEFGPIAVAMYVVSFPAISIFVGLIQIINALWGLARFLNLAGVGESKESYKYQISMFVGWFLQFLLQAVTQVGYLPSGDASQAVAVITSLSVGLNLMPAYLDFKARNVPDEIKVGYYDLAGASEGAEPSITNSVYIPDESAEA